MRILSWNIQWGRGLDGRVDLARIAAVAREFDPDVLCLQEVAVNHPGLPGWPNGVAMNQPEWLAGLFLGCEVVYGVGSDLPDNLGGRRQFGNLVISRKPILQTFRHLLPWPAEKDVPSMQRVAVEAVIEAAGLPGGALRIITTHLEYFSVAQRAAQCAALRAIANGGWQHAIRPPATTELDPPFAVLPRGEGCVICGDFNSPAGAPEQAALLEQGEAPAFENAWSVAHPAVTPAATFGVHEQRYVQTPACYDIFFVSNNLSPHVVDVAVDTGTTASDHQPVLLVLKD